jgi:hypothetical protein
VFLCVKRTDDDVFFCRIIRTEGGGSDIFLTRGCDESEDEDEDEDDSLWYFQ